MNKPELVKKYQKFVEEGTTSFEDHMRSMVASQVVTALISGNTFQLLKKLVAKYEYLVQDFPNDQYRLKLKFAREAYAEIQEGLNE